MEDLYNDLENYNDVSALQELKSENMELKTKLQDYTSAMDKLQKDFDTLSSEFKKLEHNYSSLLKTAKSEIERKTQIITNINMEKDMLILSALKKGNKSVLHIKKNIPPSNKNKRKCQSYGDVSQKCVKKNKEVQDDKNKKCDLKNTRAQEHETPSNDGDNYDSKENMYKHKVAPTAEICSYGNGHSKENVQHINIAPNNEHEYINHTVQSKSMDIKNRRKSIPATYAECERPNEKKDYTSTDGLQKAGHSKDIENRKSLLKYDNDRHGSKSSEISSRDERFSGYNDPTRDFYKVRSYKHYDGDKYRSHDKYNSSQKYKKYSPERYKKQPRDYYEDNNHRPDFGRSRVRESPPVDRSSHCPYKDHRADHERFHFDDYERYTNSKERHTGKHKKSYENEEPYNKRQKTDYYGRSKENLAWHGEETDNYELTETFEKLQEQYTSCQSPDYVDNEIASEPIKVIMDTAETYLEDPRLTTSKYILTNDNGSVSLSIAKGRHVDLEPIDKTRWELQTVSMPNALIKPPLEDQLLKDIYTDIQEPQSSLSIEFSDIDIDSQVIPNEDITQDKLTTNKIPEEILDKSNSTQKTKEKVGKPAQGCLASYKIPKIKKGNQETKSHEIVKEKSLEAIQDTPANDTKRGTQNFISGNNNVPMQNSNNKSNNDIRHHKKLNVISQNNIDVCGSQRVLSSREIVEGDLELSDETCDNTELQQIENHGAKIERTNSCNKSNIIIVNEFKDISIVSSVQNCQLEQIDNKTLAKNEHDHNIPLVEVDKSTFNDKNEEYNDINKKQKNKRKILKHKESEHAEVTEKKLKTKKVKPKEVKAKFNDLFGESSSLITPDDLGILAQQAYSPSQPTEMYVPIFEDAQDATDLEKTINVGDRLLPTTKTIDVMNTNVGKDNIESNSNIDEISKCVPEVTNYDVKASNESETIINSNIHDNLKLVNINEEGDIVKTVIISSGVQPDEINTESRAESLVNAEELLSEHVEHHRIDAAQKPQDLFIKALATSTPYKHMVQQNAIEIDSKPPDSTCNTNSILANYDNTETCVPNTTNTLEPPNEDLPDVRIFVKRRRRVVKSAK